MEITTRLITKALLISALSTFPLSTYEASTPNLFMDTTNVIVINPYENIWNAVCTVESRNDPLAVGDKHLKIFSYGISQIRQIRLDDYYLRTGIRYTLEDCFNVSVSKEIFMYYAERIGPYNLDKIIRSWNGSGPKTYTYLKLVKDKLKNIT